MVSLGTDHGGMRVAVVVRDIAWLAGLLEGEGCFFSVGSGKRNKTCPQIALNMTDKDVVIRASEIMQSRQCKEIRPKNPSYKLQYYFTVGGSLAAAWMMMLYGFLGSRRKEKIREILSLWKSSENMPRYWKGVRLGAICHPSRKRMSRGLCKGCYDAQRLGVPVPPSFGSEEYRNSQSKKMIEIWEQRRAGKIGMPKHLTN